MKMMTRAEWLKHAKGDIDDPRSIVVVGWIDDKTGSPIVGLSPHQTCIHTSLAIREAIVRFLAGTNFQDLESMHRADGCGNN